MLVWSPNHLCYRRSPTVWSRARLSASRERTRVLRARISWSRRSLSSLAFRSSTTSTGGPRTRQTAPAYPTLKVLNFLGSHTRVPQNTVCINSAVISQELRYKDEPHFFSFSTSCLSCSTSCWAPCSSGSVTHTHTHKE